MTSCKQKNRAINAEDVADILLKVVIFGNKELKKFTNIYFSQSSQKWPAINFCITWVQLHCNLPSGIHNGQVNEISNASWLTALTHSNSHTGNFSLWYSWSHWTAHDRIVNNSVMWASNSPASICCIAIMWPSLKDATFCVAPTCPVSAHNLWTKKSKSAKLTWTLPM